MKQLALGLALTAVSLLPLAGARAQTTYSDTAAAYSSSTGYSGQNNGTGFGVFNVTANSPNPPYAGTFIGDASGSENGTGTPAPSTLNTSNQAFGFYANSGSAASVTINRAFTNSLTKAGDSFSLDFLTGYNNDGTVGVSLTNGSTQLATLNYDGGSNGSANAGNFSFNGNSIAGYSSGVLHITYTLTSATSVQMQVSGAITTTQTATISGPVTGFRVYQTNANSSGSGGNNQYNGYFNNLSYTISAAAGTPEPGDLALLVLGIGVLGIARRRFVCA